MIIQSLKMQFNKFIFQELSMDGTTSLQRKKPSDRAANTTTTIMDHREDPNQHSSADETKYRKKSMCQRVTEYFRMIKFSLRALTYNSFTSSSAVLDTVMEPIFWIVDHLSRRIGPVSNISDCIFIITF